MENQHITDDSIVRVTILATKSWHDKTKINAKKKGLNVSSYLRQLAIEDDKRTLRKETAN